MRAFIIAEAGVNHNGSLETALQLVDEAAAAGVDAVKFQTFRASDLVAAHAPKAAYQIKTTDAAESQQDMIRRLELSHEDHRRLLAHTQARGLEFMSTPFDSVSLKFLTGSLGLRKIKVSSGDLTNAPFLLEIGRVSRDVILSTGMAGLSEVEEALGVLAFAWTQDLRAKPTRAEFSDAFASQAGQAVLRECLTLLHCTTEYPAPVGEVNLCAMGTMASAFGVRVGYSDHTAGIHVPVAAVARGACLIEKHFTLSRELPGPDHKASLEPDELRAMVSSIRDVEAAIGDGIKRATASERKNRDVARKSLVAARALKAGEPMDLACKRPGSGRSPLDYWACQGRPATRDYAPDELIDE